MLLAGCAVAAEEPASTVVLRDGSFEVREYPALTVAEVSVAGGQWGAANRGFRLLAGYIFGGNARQQKIEMTAPVTQQAQEGSWIVRFIMPAGSTQAALPNPDDARVRLIALPPSRYALVRFSGWALPYIVRSETERLRTWMRTRALAGSGPPLLAQYDPPWTIWFLRRNEVLILLAR